MKWEGGFLAALSPFLTTEKGGRKIQKGGIPVTRPGKSL